MWPRKTRAGYLAERLREPHPATGCASRPCSEPEPPDRMTTTHEDNHRTINLNIRLNADEHSAIARSAERLALPLSTYARNTLLGIPVTIKNYTALAPEDIGQLKRLGNLLNQIARAGWRGRYTQSSDQVLDAVLNELQGLLRKAALAVNRRGTLTPDRRAILTPPLCESSRCSRPELRSVAEQRRA